jgi:hypothetical protein
MEFDLGPLWSVLDMNNGYNRVFVNLSHMANVTNVELKLKPDFNFLKLCFLK